MKPIRIRLLLIAAVASFLAVGAPYWQIPYSKLNLPDALLEPGLFVVVLSALLLAFGDVASFWRTTWVLGASAAAAVFARVLLDGLRDPTSHNLWPIEIVIASIIGGVCALAGAIAGRMLGKLGEHRRARGR